VRNCLNLTNLNLFNSDYLYAGPIPLPENFKTKYEKTEKPKKKGFFASLFSDSSGNDFKMTAGLQFNKSLESLTVSPDENNLFTANESSLVQDMSVKGRCKSQSHHDNRDSGWISSNRGGRSNDGFDDGGFSHFDNSVCGMVSHIVRFDKTTTGKSPYTPVEEFKYELEPEVDNGISEMLALDNSHLLVLERSWDGSKVTSRIFKVSLDSASLIPTGVTPEKLEKIPALKKTLILDFDTIIPQLSPGFRVLDNFEGLAFGPKLDNGNQTLLVITDNNYSSRQRTVLLIFEILPELMK
jgi:hypothetical protein